MSEIVHPLDAALRQLGRDAASAERFEALWSAYELESGQTLGRPPSGPERQAVRLWTGAKSRDDAPTLLAKWPVLQAALYTDVKQKADILTQLGCARCHTDPVITPLALRFAIPVEPWSSQSRSDRRKIRESVMDRLTEKQLPRMPLGDHPLCLTVASVVPAHKRGAKDVDNLVKGLLDALQGSLYPNDRQIQCLTSRRLEYAGPVGNYVVGARPVVPVTTDVIFDDPAPPRFA